MKKGEMPSWSLGGGRSYPKTGKEKKKESLKVRGKWLILKIFCSNRMR